MTKEEYDIGCEVPYEKPFKTCRWEEIRSKKGTIIGLKCDGCDYRPIYDVSSRYCPNCGALMANYLNYACH